MFHTLCVFNNRRLQTLGVCDVNCLNVAVELLLCVLLIVTLTRDAHAKSEWHTLNTLLPHLLVELGVEADVFGALQNRPVLSTHLEVKRARAWWLRSAAAEVARPCTNALAVGRGEARAYHGFLSERSDLLDCSGSSLLEGNTVDLIEEGAN